MSTRWRLALVVILLVGCGVAVYMGSIDQPVSLSSVLEVWGDVLRDVDHVSLRLTRVSDREETQLGQDLARNLAPWWPERQDWQPYVSAVGRRVAAGRRRQGVRYEFHVVEAGAPNAFALPGGQVYITTAMLGMVQTEAELAEVLGHEIAHVDLRHAVEHYQYALKLKRIGAAPVGELAEAVRSLLSVDYQKYQELDADARGVALSVEAGYEPDAITRVFQRFATQLREPQPHRAKTPASEVTRALAEAPSAYFRSHPWFWERSARLNQMLARQRRRLKGRTFYRGAENYKRRIPRSQHEFAGELV